MRRASRNGGVTSWALAVVLLLSVQEGKASGDAQVFDLGSSLNSFQYTVMMTIVLLGLVTFDLALEAFEHYLHHHKRRFHKRLLAKSIKELMILGFISFVMFILEDQAVIDKYSDDEVFANTFDFVNLFLFFVGISLVMSAVLLAMFTSPLKARWDTFANVPLEDFVAVHNDIMSKPWTYYAAWLPRYFKALRQAQIIEYHLFRSVFLRLNRSLLTPAFDFAKYSAAIVDEIIIDNFDISWQSWLLAIIVLFFTLPITVTDSGHSQVSAQGAIVFGLAVLLMEVSAAVYITWAHQKVRRRMGVTGGFKDVCRVLEELWVQPRHYMGEETAAISVKDLLAAAPVKAPTLSQLTSSSKSGKGISHAQINFQSGRTRRPSLPSLKGSSKDELSSASPEKTSLQQTSQGSAEDPCPKNGLDCSGCITCDELWLPPNAVQHCEMGGDPFILTRVRPPQCVVNCLPQRFKDVTFKVGSCSCFTTLFGMCILQKCYYVAFYLSYGIGRATESDTLEAVLWVVLVPIPLLLALLPLAKRTIPLYAQLSCLQGQIVWELVSDIEEQQEMAERARDKVVSKLQEALSLKAEEHKRAQKMGKRLKSPVMLNSPRSTAMKEWFAEWDKNGDNSISSSELSDGLSRIGVFLSEAELKELFRLADPDHSKSIDLDEFQNFLSDLRSLEDEPQTFRRELEIRSRRSSMFEEMARQSRVNEAGLLVVNSRTQSAGPQRAASFAMMPRRAWTRSGNDEARIGTVAEARGETFDRDVELGEEFKRKKRATISGISRPFSTVPAAVFDRETNVPEASTVAPVFSSSAQPIPAEPVVNSEASGSARLSE